jgi:beta-xylosidase
METHHLMFKKKEKKSERENNEEVQHELTLFSVSSQPNFIRLSTRSISFSFYRTIEEMCKEHIHIQKKTKNNKNRR